MSSSSPDGTTPNSNFVSASTMPARSQTAAPCAYSASEAARTRWASSGLISVSTRANGMFSSWTPAGAFQAGVNSGSGSRSLSRRPGGSGIPHTSPVAAYSFQPEPER